MFPFCSHWMKYLQQSQYHKQPTTLSIRGWKQEEIDQKLSETPLGRFATPEDTAKLCVFLLSDDASFITGENIWINGGKF